MSFRCTDTEIINRWLECQPSALTRSCYARDINRLGAHTPKSLRQINRSPMPTARNHILAAAVNGKIYAIGGRLGSAIITAATTRMRARNTTLEPAKACRA